MPIIVISKEMCYNKDDLNDDDIHRSKRNKKSVESLTVIVKKSFSYAGLWRFEQNEKRRCPERLAQLG